MRIYIAGPMSGLPNDNFEAFNGCAERLARAGHEVYNPATTFNGDHGLPYDLYLREAVRLVSMVNGMVLLPGWARSRGALTEVHVGLSCLMPFYWEKDGELNQIDIDYIDLADYMTQKYGVREWDAESNGVSEVSGRDSREAEEWQDYVVGQPLEAAPGVGEAFFRRTTESRMPSNGGGSGGSLALQEPASTPRHRGLLSRTRSRLVGEALNQERSSSV